MKKWFLGIFLLPLHLAFLGCGSSYTLHVVDGGAREIYITHSKSTEVKVGDVFAVYHMMPHNGGGGGHNHGGGSGSSEMVMVATVKIDKIIDEETAEVEVVSGTVHNGAIVEKYH